MPDARRTVWFNTAGKHFEVARSTIEKHPDTLLAKMIQDEWHPGAPSTPIFVDLDPETFQLALQWYRFGFSGIEESDLKRNDVRSAFGYLCIPLEEPATPSLAGSGPLPPWVYEGVIESHGNPAMRQLGKAAEFMVRRVFEEYVAECDPDSLLRWAVGRSSTSIIQESRVDSFIPGCHLASVGAVFEYNGLVPADIHARLTAKFAEVGCRAKFRSGGPGSFVVMTTGPNGQGVPQEINVKDQWVAYVSRLGISDGDQVRGVMAGNIEAA